MEKIKQFFEWLKKNSRLSLLAIIFFVVAASWTNMNNGLWNRDHGVVIHDVISYYSYLPALFVYHDLSFKFIGKDPAYFQGKIFNSKTKDGGNYQKMTMGLSFLYLPFFLLGYASAWLIGTPLDGFSYPFMCWLLFSSVFYVFIGLLYLRKTLLRFFDDQTVAFVLIFITIGTNLFFYTTLEGAMSHAYNFSLIAVFLYLTIIWHENPSRNNSIYAGLIFGLISLIRPTNVLIVIIFLLYNIISFNDLKDKFSFYLNHYSRLLTIAFFAFLIIFPQLLFWKLNTGHWLYYSYKEEGFFFLKPEIYRGLFSYRKGWLVYTPIMIFAITGFYFLRKRMTILFLPIIIFTIINIYVIFSWWDWSYGGSFGARAMIDSYALMAIPMSAFVEKILNSKRLLRTGTLAFMFLLVMFNIFQILQYKYATIHFCEMSKESYWHSFGKLKADIEFYNLLEPLDYKKLIKGEYATIPKIRESIGPDAVTGFEEFSRFKNNFISTDGHYEFKDAKFQSNLAKHSGQNSMLLCGENKFGGGIEFYINEFEKYELTVWKYPANAKAAIVFASPDGELYYKQVEIISKTDAIGWGSISFEAEIPEGRSGKYRAYLWNKTTDSVYFDDFSIKKLR